jgi:hypothetical protein
MPYSRNDEIEVTRVDPQDVSDTVDIPAGGWGSAKATLSILAQEHAAVAGTKAILRQNKHDGFTCVSCSWAKPATSSTGEWLHASLVRHGDTGPLIPLWHHAKNSFVPAAKSIPVRLLK